MIPPDAKVEIRIGRTSTLWSPDEPSDLAVWFPITFRPYGRSDHYKIAPNSLLCYVDDLIRGLDSLMQHPTHIELVNLGNPGEFTIKQLAEKVVEKINPKLNIVYHPLPEDDPLQRKPDISQAKSLLNWEPIVKLDQGLDKTIEHFSRLLHASSK